MVRFVTSGILLDDALLGNFTHKVMRRVGIEPSCDLAFARLQHALVRELLFLG